MRTMGLDVGIKRIGVALSDPGGVLASPLTVITEVGEQAALKAIHALCNQHEVQRIVVGLPRSMDGTIGRQGEKVQAFSRRLSEFIRLPVDAWDERLSTVAAERAMVDAGVKRAGRVKRRDAVAAALILQGYLDSKQAG